MQRTIARAHLHDFAVQQAADMAYWLSQPVQARLEAVEVLRKQYHEGLGQSYADIAFQRVCRITPLKPR